MNRFLRVGRPLKAGITAVTPLIMILIAAIPCAQAAQDGIEIPITLISQAGEEYVPISLLDPIIDDSGLAGAEQGIRDNNTTGRFTGQAFRLSFHQIRAEDSAADLFRQQHALGVRLFLLDLPAAVVVELADLPEAADSLLFNIGATDNNLRTQVCAENLLHTAPSRAMLADALAQYLAWKRWTRWFLVVGGSEEDRAFAASLKRAAARFGAKIVEEKRWTFKAGARRTDSGHTKAQQVVNSFTQVGDYDILLVADERDVFGDYLSYRTYLPRPVGGTQGMGAKAWSRVHEQWGATQFQNRFKRASGRWMSELDYAAWIAVRSIGEAATRVQSCDPLKLREYLRGPEFRLAAFKGSAVTYRDWNGQLRQPLLITSPRMLVSVSPQKGFLHQFSILDTLGFDRQEISCP